MSGSVDYAALNRIQRYTQWAAFKAIPGLLEDDREDVIEDAREFFSQLEKDGIVTLRGVYDVTGLRAEADYVVWWHAEEFADLQKAFDAFRKTKLGKVSEVFWIGNGLHRPAEFNKRHIPAFIRNKQPDRWMTLYPFVRSYDWYVMDPMKRAAILREHGAAAHDYPDVMANTVEAFALGDYEWMLCFEGPELHRIVDLMKTMRATKARLHVREEIPFFSGRRVDDVAEIINALP